MARLLLPSRGDRDPADTMANILTDAVYPAAGGVTMLALTDAANVVYTAAQSPGSYIRMTGSLTAARTLTLTRDDGTPACFAVENATSYTLTVKVTSGGSSVAIPPGFACRVKSDGTNLILDPSSEGAGSAFFLGYQTAAAAPTTTHFPSSGQWGFFWDSLNAKFYVVFNRSGTIYKGLMS